MSENKQIDINLLQGYLDNLGAEIVQKMLDLYIQQSKLYVENISLAVEMKSQSHWQESCHKMKGAAGSVGLLFVHKELVELEKSIASWDVKATAIVELTKLNNQAKIAFQQWLDEC